MEPRPMALILVAVQKKCEKDRPSKMAISQWPTGGVNNTLSGTSHFPRKRTLSRARAVTQSQFFLRGSSHVLNVKTLRIV